MKTNRVPLSSIPLTSTHQFYTKIPLLFSPQIPQFHTENPSVQHTPHYHTKNQGQFHTPSVSYQKAHSSTLLRSTQKSPQFHTKNPRFSTENPSVQHNPQFHIKNPSLRHTWIHDYWFLTEWFWCGTEGKVKLRDFGVQLRDLGVELRGFCVELRDFGC